MLVIVIVLLSCSCSILFAFAVGCWAWALSRSWKRFETRPCCFGRVRSTQRSPFNLTRSSEASGAMNNWITYLENRSAAHYCGPPTGIRGSRPSEICCSYIEAMQCHQVKQSADIITILRTRDNNW